MQIGLGVLLVAAVLLTLAAAAWPVMTVQAQNAGYSTQIGAPTGEYCWYEYKTVEDYCMSCGWEKAIYHQYKRLCCSWGCYGWAHTGDYCSYC